MIKFIRSRAVKASTVAGSLAAMASAAHAEVPAAISTAIASMQEDGVTVATAFVVAAIAVAAIKFPALGTLMAQVGPFCYGTDLAAVRVIAGQQVGAVVSEGSALYVVDAQPASASSIAYTLTPLSGGPVITHTVGVTMQPCGLLDWSDGLSLGWAVAGVWLAAYAVLILRKAAHQ